MNCPQCNAILMSFKPTTFIFKLLNYIIPMITGVYYRLQFIKSGQPTKDCPTCNLLVQLSDRWKDVSISKAVIMDILRFPFLLLTLIPFILWTVAYILWIPFYILSSGLNESLYFLATGIAMYLGKLDDLTRKLAGVKDSEESKIEKDN